MTKCVGSEFNCEGKSEFLELQGFLKVKHKCKLASLWRWNGRYIMLCKIYCTSCCDWKKNSYLISKQTPQIVLFSLWLVSFSYHPPSPLHPYPWPSSSLISLSFSEAVPLCQPIPAYLWPKNGCAWLILLIRDWMPAVHSGRREEKGKRTEGWRWKNWEMIGITIAILVLKISRWICLEP